MSMGWIVLGVIVGAVMIVLSKWHRTGEPEGTADAGVAVPPMGGPEGGPDGGDCGGGDGGGGE